MNRDVLYELLSNISGPTDVDPATDNQFKVSDIAQAIENTKAYNFHPNKLVMNARAEGLLLGDSNLVYVSYAGTDSTLKTGRLPTIWGLKPYLCTATTGSTSVYWDSTDSATHYMAMVLDTDTPVGFIGMRRDLNVEKYDDPINDLLGIKVTMRYGVGVTQAAAGCRILTT